MIVKNLIISLIKANQFNDTQDNPPTSALYPLIRYECGVLPLWQSPTGRLYLSVRWRDMTPPAEAQRLPGPVLVLTPVIG